MNSKVNISDFYATCCDNLYISHYNLQDGSSLPLIKLPNVELLLKIIVLLNVACHLNGTGNILL